MRLANKVVIITGAASGMGEAMAITFAEQGAKVIATDIQAEKLDGLIERIKSTGGEAIGILHDVTDRDTWFEKVIPQAIKAFGKIDVLINNAGISISTPFEEQRDELWKKVFDININGIMLGMQAVLPHMKEKGGSIINISSIAGLRGISGPGAYTASKGSVAAITRGAAVDFGAYNIRVNTISPGYIETPMTEKHFEEYGKYFLSIIPVKRIGIAKDIANAALFLASDESMYVTGINMPVDGGTSIK
ncbi:SDR family oxidoreductase [Chryseobacterium sp. G0186]|uniref:SDR family NAD(P)-dependent oxidoreductase n=1 Tax=Chryseobacterium sp. G0186 TaxID=2487064 RepID=UPI000F4D94DA|nr:SDR family NAD(P)-dependent oxidoreductase [Chryseobacterium sp. G0186]AZA76061.1 SDR family oxidoreductase [Chryseobacterium sp. G0186]